MKLLQRVFKQHPEVFILICSCRVSNLICLHSILLFFLLYEVHEDTIKVSAKSKDRVFIFCGHPQFALHTDLWIYVNIDFAKPSYF